MSLKDKLNYDALYEVCLLLNNRMVYGETHYVYLYKDKKNYYLTIDMGMSKQQPQYFFQVTNNDLFKLLNKKVSVYNLLSKHNEIYAVNHGDGISYDNLKEVTIKPDFSTREYVIDNVFLHKYTTPLLKKLYFSVRKDKINSILNGR